ncbi:peptidase U32 [Spirochaetia bacterium]|nr:peptidase U32 [Spirochaetia bacterium]
MKPVELLAPAGSPEALDAAIGEGADAVYLGLKNFNARMRSANFAYSQFEGALKVLHRMGRKLYVTVNTVFEQREADRLYQLLKYLAVLGPDGLIVQDFGVAAMVRDNFPSLKLHASTQMNIASARGANALSKYGFSRVVLARELCLGELRDCRANTNMELEVFVHGALCVSASGICLFSSYLGGKSANRGMCTQACRRFYHRDDDGGYYFSPADLQLLEWVPDLADAGVSSFKIEGRMKSAEYVGTVVSAYRLVLDALAADEGKEKVQEKIAEGLGILHNDFARTKTRFYFDENFMPKIPATEEAPVGADAPDKSGSAAAFDTSAAPRWVDPPAALDWLNPAQDGGTGIPLGNILKVRGAGEERRGLIPAGALQPKPGDSVRLHRADDSDRQSHKLTVVEPERQPAHAGEGGGKEPVRAGVWLSIPEGFDTGDAVYLIQTKAMSRRYAPVIPHNLDSFRRMPGRDKAPPLELPNFRKGDAGGGGFPEGLYAAVSRIDDLYILQSSRPVRAMLAYTRKTAAYLLGNGKAPLPFNSGEIILVLDPYFPQSAEAGLAEEVKELMERGYRQFVVNNPGHFSCFRTAGLARQGSAGPARQGSKPPILIAGPYLYIFNRWANQFMSELGADNFISPLENNRQNLEKTVSPGRRALTFITVFAYPALFRIRSDLSKVYKFKDFSDSRGEQFALVSGPDGSMVYPEKPFSLVDKIPFLQEAGFSRFILDFSGPPLKKSDYRDIVKSAKDSIPLPDISRFNWKDGFYQTEGAGSIKS